MTILNASNDNKIEYLIHPSQTAECAYKLDKLMLQAYHGSLIYKYYLLTNWLAYLYGRIQSPRPDVMPDRREGITRVAGFVFACIDTQPVSKKFIA